MSLNLERIEWMPSPPLAPGGGPIDFDHLRRMTLGDAAIEQEVLAMFSAQTADLLNRLVALPAEMPVGIVTAFVGAPVLVLLVRRNRRVTGL